MVLYVSSDGMYTLSANANAALKCSLASRKHSGPVPGQCLDLNAYVLCFPKPRQKSACNVKSVAESVGTAAASKSAASTKTWDYHVGIRPSRACSASIKHCALHAVPHTKMRHSALYQCRACNGDLTFFVREVPTSLLR